MATDFNKVINRKGTHSLKYDFATVRGKKADLTGKSRVTGSSKHQELYLHLQWQ